MPGSPRIPLGRAHALASSVIRELQRNGFRDVHALGSLRRFSPDVGDVSLLVTAKSAQRANATRVVGALPMVHGVTHDGDRLRATTDRGDVSIVFASPDQHGSALAWHTGSRAHTAILQARAAKRGLRFDNGLLWRGDAWLACPGEHDFYAHLGLPFIPPELREGGDEIDAAERGLPELIADTHIRGDLHMHSTWSDGRSTVAEMAAAAHGLGYEYIAITDHSERALCARKLTRADVPRQRDEIAAVRDAYPSMAILHGIEVDIMKDGSLDFDDETLAGFDIVLASLHDHGGQDGAELTERYLKAMRHPLVSVITHPTNRSPAHSAGYNVDLDRLFAAAVETGTAMEIDGAPGHLDMDGAVARRAVAAGVTVVIDSDCHRAEWLRRQMRFGVGTARRGWVEARHVLNTRRIADVRTFIARKRAFA